MRKFRFKVGLDVDDVLFECVDYAIKLANEKYNFYPPITINEITSWGVSGNRSDVIFDFFNDEEFYKDQPVIKGAVEFVKELSKKADVYFITAVYPEFMSIRALRLIKEFPFIPKEHIMMGSSKELLSLDLIFDDGGHNICSSSAAFPILMRKPWNNHLTGLLAVNNYDEFLSLIDLIAASYVSKAERKEEPSVVALIGPSGSGKSTLMMELLKLSQFEKPITYSTREPREEETPNAYHFIRKERFLQMKKEGMFFETTVYAGNYYGTVLKDIQTILDKGKHALLPIDITGAVAMKANLPTVLFYIDRSRRLLIKEIIERNCSSDEKTNRIISLNSEEKNKDICDYIINNNGTIEESIRQVMKHLEQG